MRETKSLVSFKKTNANGSSFFPNLLPQSRMCQGSGCACWYWLIVPWWKNNCSHRTQQILRVRSRNTPWMPAVPVSVAPRQNDKEKLSVSELDVEQWCGKGKGGGLQNATYFIKHKSIDLFIQQPGRVINLNLESQQAQGQSVITPPTAINGIFTMMSLMEGADSVSLQLEQAPHKVLKLEQNQWKLDLCTLPSQMQSNVRRGMTETQSGCPLWAHPNKD